MIELIHVESNVDPSRINPRNRLKVMHRFTFCEIQAIFPIDCVIIRENRTLEHSVFQLIRINRDYRAINSCVSKTMRMRIDDRTLIVGARAQNHPIGFHTPDENVLIDPV